MGPKQYHTLTARGQARRLRRLAFTALAQYDLDVSRLSLVTNNFNGIFRVDTHDGQKYILRITLPEGGHNRDHVAGEMAWLAALARDTTLSVPRPLPARNGALVVDSSALDVPESRLVGVFSWVPGTNLARHITPSNLTRLGRLMAGLHNHALTFKPPEGLSLLKYDRLFPFLDPILLFDDAYAAIIPPERRQIFQQACAWVQSALDRLAASKEPMRILHNDLHQWNVRICRGVLSPIDFEDFMWGWPVQDIATTLYYFIDREDYPALLNAFHAGYTSLSPWPERFPGEINAFIAGRALDLANFMLQETHMDQRKAVPEFLVCTEKQLRIMLAKSIYP
jgi:Ser/Thr protein kinase RdoA (MazF antagonist)